MPKEFDDCVSGLKGKKGVDSAYAICVAAYKKKHGKSPFHKKEEIEELVEIGEGMKRQLLVQFEAEQQGKTIKILEHEVVGGAVKIAETKTPEA